MAEPTTVARPRRMLLVGFLEPWSMGSGMGAPSLHETLAGWARAGWEVDYLTFTKRSVGGVAHETDVAVDVPGVRVWRFSIPTLLQPLGTRVQAKADRLLLFPVGAACEIARRMADTRYDVVYAYEISAIIACHLARRLSRWHGLLVHRIQGIQVLEGRFRQAAFMARKLENLLALRAHADLYIMTNDGTHGDEAWRYWNADVGPHNLLHIRNGIDGTIGTSKAPRDVTLSSSGIAPGAFVALMVSRLDPIKRIDRGIRMVAALRERTPQLRLVIAGDGEDRAHLEALARELGVDDRVHFLGGVSRGRVADLMNAADLFLSLYDFSNCGNPLFEALLCGRPIVTLANGATPEVITDGVNGRLVEPDDTIALEQAVCALIEDDHARERLSAGARAWARANLTSWDERLAREIRFVESKVP